MPLFDRRSCEGGHQFGSDPLAIVAGESLAGGGARRHGGAHRLAGAEPVGTADGLGRQECLKYERRHRGIGLKGSTRHPRAFEEVFAEHVDALFRTALRLCRGNQADAEDLLQDSALRAFTGFGQLREQSAARAWLFTILTRTHLNRLRSAGRRSESSSTDLDERAFEAALAEWTPVLSPADELERRQLGVQLTEALNRLPIEIRSAVWLVDVEGFTQREAAGMLDVPEGTIASRLFRGRRQLRAVLEGPAREPRIRRTE